MSSMCPQTHGNFKKMHQQNREKPPILKAILRFATETSYSNEQQTLMDGAEVRWGAFLKDEVPHPAEFEQHLLIFDIVESTTVSDLPTNFNRFMTGAVT